jgi:hypothetical protein
MPVGFIMRSKGASRRMVVRFRVEIQVLTAALPGVGCKTRFFLLLDFLNDMEDEVYMNPHISMISVRRNPSCAPRRGPRGIRGGQEFAQAAKALMEGMNTNLLPAKHANDAEAERNFRAF